ncbi:phosphate/phosphite/phosphonate ABC transporter substrate-binding protein [Celeribacter sp.]|uniref:phosphate/phosphite/phosphonate ABC transporter substrate-binding protein n=1 Tax=Celeribacter sp. TaxID=1890673 RepID=UPI003A91B1ED
MIAQLPMYWRRENAAAHTALWGLIRDGLRARAIDAPDRLDTSVPYDHAWRRPDLVLSQVCNLPLRSALKGKVTLIGASDYGLAQCPAGYYRSYFVVRDDHRATRPTQLDGARMAYNDEGSHSGWGAPMLWALNCGVTFNPILHTGAHAASAAAVLSGEVDFACIDAQTWRDLRLYLPQTRRLRIIGVTDVSPGQTFCTAYGADPAPYFAAISEAIAHLPRMHKATLGLKGIVRLRPQAYDLPLPQEPHVAANLFATHWPSDAG